MKKVWKYIVWGTEGYNWVRIGLGLSVGLKTYQVYDMWASVVLICTSAVIVAWGCPNKVVKEKD